MAMESPNQNQFSPEIQELRRQVAALTSRIEALEQNRIPIRPAPALRPSSDSRFGLAVVNRVGAVTLALGILFFFKYAAENNWIGPLARVLLGALCGLAFLAFGEWLTRRNQRGLAFGITGCGISILYIAAYASSAYYHLLLHGASFVLMVCVCALAVAAGLRYRIQTLACFGFGLAAFTIPVMKGELYVGLRPTFLLLSAATGLAIAILQSWPILPAFNALSILLAGAVPGMGGASYALLCFVVAAGYWAAPRFRAAAPPLQTVLYITAHAVFLIGCLRLINAYSPGSSLVLTLASVLLTAYGTALLALGLSRPSEVDRGIGLTLIGIVIAKLYLYDVWLLKYGFRITAFVALGILLLGASFVYGRYKTRT